MAFRNPIYLNSETLRNLADYHGIELQTDAQVTRRSLDERSRKAGVNRGLELGAGKTSTDEVTEVYTTQIRPVRAMNDVIDQLIRDESLTDLVEDPDKAVVQRDVVQIEGSLTLSPVTEIGAMMTSLMPMMLGAVADSPENPAFDPRMIGQVVMTNQGQAALHVLEMDTTTSGGNVYVLAEPQHMFGSATPDDLEGELTIFGTVDRLVAPGASYSLERHLLPGLSRTARRLLHKEGIPKLLAGFESVVGRELQASEIAISGPALLITPIAAY
jgi:hypothetical protein